MGAVFLGTPAAAVPSLAALADVADVDLVVTQPDKAKGRGALASGSAVGAAARQFGFDVAQPESRTELRDTLAEGGFDFGLVVAYGRILSEAMLASTELGFLNVHFSLLPRWRGAAPVERAIAAGDDRTGVTLMKIDRGLDTGPVLAEIATPIAPDETGGSLTARLSYLGATLVDKTVPEYLTGRRRPVPQLDSAGPHAEMLNKKEAELDPTWSVDRAERTVRAFAPRPGTWMTTDAGVLKVHSAQPTPEPCPPGIIAKVHGLVLAGFADGAIELVSVQPADKSTMDAKSWMNGRRGESAVFESAP